MVGVGVRIGMEENDDDVVDEGDQISLAETGRVQFFLEHAPGLRSTVEFRLLEP